MKKNDKKLTIKKAHAKVAEMLAAYENPDSSDFSHAEFAEAYDFIEAHKAKQEKKEVAKRKFQTYLPKLAHTISETAYMLGVDEKSVRRLLERGLLKTSKALRTKQITRESIDNYLNDAD